MKSRIKIWFAPMAALAIVLMLVAVVFAAAPKVGTQISDVEITITASSSPPTDQPSLTDADGGTEDGDGDGTDTNDAAFTDEDAGDTLVYTAATSNERVADVTLTGDTTSVVTEWWDRLGAVDNAGEPDNPDTDCSKRAAVLGFTAGAGIRGQAPADANPHRAGLEESSAGAGDAVQATGLCSDFLALSGISDNPRTTIVEDNYDADGAIVDAFHWDMLDGPEMEAVADAANEATPSAYKKRFGDLDTAGQAKVSGWFTTGFLAKGTGGLGVSNDGRDGSAPEGQPGTATIYVSASDSEGRFLRNSVSQSFTVTAVLTDAPDIPGFGDSAGTNSMVVGTKGSLADYRDVNAQEGIEEARFDVRVAPDAEDIATVNLGNFSLDDHQQSVTFSLTNGGDVSFQILQEKRAIAATIQKKPGVTLESGDPYKFTLVANEIGRAPENSETVDIWVEVVLDNVKPSFPTTESSGTVAERAKNETIATFNATDRNNQVITYTIPSAVADALGIEIGATSGVLKTKDMIETPTDLPDFIEDNPDTANTDESENDDGTSKNVHEIVITASDGTLEAKHTFTLTVTDEDDPPPGSRQKLNIAEDNDGGLENYFGSAPDLGGSGAYSIGEQIDNQGNIAGSENPEDVLFDVDSTTGKVFLMQDDDGDPLPIDYESGIVTYTVSITRTPAAPAPPQSGIIVVRVEDVNEGPKFDEDDHDRYDLENMETDDNEIVLYVLESAAVGSIVKIGKDAGGNPATINAIFAATDEDTKAAFQGTAYDLWHDADTTDNDDEFTDAYAGAIALFTVDADGAVTVAKALDTDADDSESSISLKLRAYDTTEDIPDPIDEDDETPEELRRVLKDVLPIRIEIIDTNVAPVFDDPSRAQTHASVSEGAAVGTVVHTYRATDEDGDTVRYRLRDEDDAPFFSVEETMNADDEEIGVLKTAAGLDYETNTSHTVEIQAYDTDGDTDEIVVEIEITNVNDEAPVFDATPRLTIPVAENTPRGTILANYSASDGDGDTVTYSLQAGGNSKSFYIDAATGDLKTLESLDYDSNTPCPVTGCSVTIIASDGTNNAMHNGSEPSITITVSPVEDSVSTLSVTKANPVPGTTMGDANTALGNTKTSMSDDVPERPADLPSANGAPLNFVETDWANWGTVLRIEVTAQSPDANCGSGNECVVISLNSDSADDTLKLQAYRMNTAGGRGVEREQVRSGGDAG